VDQFEKGDSRVNRYHCEEWHHGIGSDDGNEQEKIDVPELLGRVEEEQKPARLVFRRLDWNSPLSFDPS
jgi:hypothetical protein